MGAGGLGGRRRWATLIIAVLAAGALSVGLLLSNPRAADGPAVVSITSTPVSNPIAPGFIGLSLEFQAVQAYAGSDPDKINPVLVQLIRNLTPGQAPVLRIGGDSTDSTWWPTAGVTVSPGVSHRLTIAWLQTTRALAATLGARLIMGINLAADNPAIAAAEARAFTSGIGSRYIEAFEIGNEPDLYGRDPWYRIPGGHAKFARAHGYSMSSFTEQFSRWRQALPGAPLAGPAFAWLGWMNRLSRFLGAEPGVKLVTFHRYPLRRCNHSADLPLYGSIPDLLSDVSSAALARPLGRYASIAHAHGLSFRVDELNSVSCHGEAGVSNSFASALWALDTLFSFARAGVDGVNIHTFPGASYQLFAFSQSNGRWSASVKPEYYGLQMFAQAAPPGARLLATDGPAGSVKRWATLAPDGTTRLVLINDDTIRARTVVIRPPHAAGVASIERLLAPGAAATGGVTLDGESFGENSSTGILPRPARQSFVLSGRGAYTLTLPAGSAAMLTLIPGLTGEL